MDMLEFFKQYFGLILALTTYCAELGSLLQFEIGSGTFKHGVLDIMVGNVHALADNLDLLLLYLVLLTVARILVIDGRTQCLVAKH